MERRYDLLHETGFRDITGYNAAHARGDLEAGLGELDDDGEPREYRRLPFILVVVDELADLMMVAARDVEDSICRIAQMARAVGIHLVIATQRPSINVITGVIKANIPARLAFAVSSLTDSRVILDQPGAERLVGQGDMLFLGPSSSAPQRIQGAWVTEDEVRKTVAAWRRQEIEVEAVVGVDTETITDGGGVGASGGERGGGTDDDELLEQAMELVIGSQLGSTSMLQRKLRVGFARAGRLMDLLEERGIVGPSTGSKAREVLVSSDELGLEPVE
jgi:S-DNA-T family DNA segregation ATPase FtsK/SpoIIIE